MKDSIFKLGQVVVIISVLCLNNLSAQNKEEIDSLFDKAATLANQGQVADGIAILEKMLSNSDLDDLDNMLAKSFLARFYVFEDFEKSEAYLKEVILSLGKVKNGRKKIYILNNISDAYFFNGFYGEAVNYIVQAVELSNKQKDLYPAELALYSNYLLTFGNTQQAIEIAEKALILSKKEKLQKIIQASLGYLGVAQCAKGEYKKGAQNITEAIFNEPDKYFLTELAFCYLGSGEFGKAEKIINELGHRDILGWGINAALSYLSGEYEKAIYKFDRMAKSMRDDLRLDFCYIGEGLSYEKLKNFVDSENMFREAVLYIEDKRYSLSPDERFFFLNGKVHIFKRIEAYEGLIRSLYSQNKIADAFYYSEHLKARFLGESLAQKSKHSGGKKISDEVLNGKDLLSSKIRSMKNQIHFLKRKGANRDFVQNVRAELDLSVREHNEFISKLRNKYPEYAAIYYPNPLKHSEIMLAGNESIVEFEVTDSSVLAFLINKKGGLKSYSAKISRKELGEMVVNYRSYFSGIKQASDLGRFSPSAGLKLYRTLFGDLLENVPAGNRLIIVPDEILGILPFDTLPTEIPAKEKMGEGEYGPFPLGIKYLGDKYEISFTQSATTLTLHRTLKKKMAVGNSSIVIADPVFSVNDSRIANTGLKPAKDEKSIQLMGTIAKWRNMGVAGIVEKGSIQQKSQKDDEFFPRLEKTTILVEWMKKLFGKDTKVLSGASATEKDVLKTNFEPYRFITFATHGILDSTVPGIKEPALVLSQVGNDEKYDGFLTMSEVMGMTIRADVVALTACDTGLGENVSGEGVMGLGRAFQYAGARNVLMSLWSVEEAASVDLTSMFFANLKEGKEPGVALKAAKEKIRQKGYEHPFYWSSFILMGY